MVVLVLAAIRMQRLIERTPPRGSRVIQVGLAAMLVLTALGPRGLYQHAEEWATEPLRNEAIAQRESWGLALVTLNVTDPLLLAGTYYVQVKKEDLSVHVIEFADPLYVGVLYASLIVSLAAWLAWIYCYRKPEVVERLYAAIDERIARTALFRRTPAPEKSEVLPPSD
jgi:hypothetical protein